jgi:hypothetical protein
MDSRRELIIGVWRRISLSRRAGWERGGALALPPEKPDECKAISLYVRESIENKFKPPRRLASRSLEQASAIRQRDERSSAGKMVALET